MKTNTNKKKHGVLLLCILLFVSTFIISCSKKEDTKDSINNQTDSNDNNQDDDADLNTDQDDKNSGDSQEDITNNDSTEDSEANENQQVEKKTPLVIYYGDSNVQYLLSKEVVVEEIAPNYIVEELILENVLPENVKVNRIEFLEDNGESAMKIDFSSAFAERLAQLGTSGELIMIGSVTNTFLEAYKVEKMLMTVDGQTVESGHSIYDEYLYPFENSVETTTIDSILINGQEEDVELNIFLISEWGMEFGYDSSMFQYNYDEELKIASFMAPNPDVDVYPNVFLSISTSDYSLEDTVAGLKLQASTDQIVESQNVPVGSETGTMIEIRDGEADTDRIVKFYVIEKNGKTFLIEVDYYAKVEDNYLPRFEQMLNLLSFVE